MGLVAKMKNIMMIDCAIAVAPNSNKPKVVRDSFNGTDIIVQVRPSSDAEKALGLLERL